MRSLVAGLPVFLAALLVVAGCDDGPAEPAYRDGMPLTVQDVEGTWQVEVPRTLACLPNRDPFIIHLELQHSHLASYVGSENEEYFTGAWWVDPGAEPWFAQGWVDMTAHTFRFLLWQDIHGKGTVFRGHFLAGGNLRASLEEPIPAGDGWAADPIGSYPGGFAIGDCQWSVEGHRPRS
jgi:hypothetical protein